MKQLTLDTKLKARDLFSSLQPEEEQIPDRIPEIKPNPNLEYLVREYEGFIKKAIDYDKAEELYKELKLNTEYLISKNIEQFSLTLSNYEQLRNFYISGYFISRVINDSKDEEFRIHTNHLDSLISYLGYKNTKNMIVNGDFGHCVGYLMQNGTITVKGNAGHCVGYSMKNGKITINGNAVDEVGRFMQGGNILINGNAGYCVGLLMEHGTINLNGNYVSSSTEIKGGNIYHKRKLIVENGKTNQR